MALVFANDGASSGMSSRQRNILTAQRCTVTAIWSCVEWEPESFPLVAPLLGKPVMALGLLPPPPDGSRIAAATKREHAAVRWLDAQPPGSVLYVALGSEVPLRVNQVSVLAHAAVGGFLTHCGRNSLIEGILFGHPLVMLPIFGDQGPNARQMEAKNVGIQVARDEEDGSFEPHGVASAVRAVMLEGEARRGFLAGAARMHEVVAEAERHERYVDKFVEHLRSISYTDATPTTSS
ncbi:hypothetical protein ACQ4PT_048896 [Festuca glaucescens]